MTDSVKILVAAAAVLALVVGGGLFGRMVGQITDRADVAAPPPTASATPSPTAATFTSALYRYRVAYPPTWHVDDPLGDIVTFRVEAPPTPGTLIHVDVADTTPSGGLYWPWGGTHPVTGADLATFAAAAIADLRGQGLDVVANRPTTLGGRPARQLEVARIDFGEGEMPMTVLLSHRGDLYQAILLYGPLGAPEFEAFLASFAFTDPPAMP